MPVKIKVSPEEKVRLVCAYMSGHLSASEFARQYKTKDQVLYDWVRLYQTRGAEGSDTAACFVS